MPWQKNVVLKVNQPSIKVLKSLPGKLQYSIKKAFLPE
jgi:hypothetical protein